jgi:hypothetical protein
VRARLACEPERRCASTRPVRSTPPAAPEKVPFSEDRTREGERALLVDAEAVDVTPKDRSDEYRDK